MILDSETAAMIEIAKREAPFAFLQQTGIQAMGQDVPLRPEIEKWLKGRIEWVQAGVERVPKWFDKTLKRFDPNLRLRWDSYQDHWVIEHFSKDTNLWHRCGTWDRPLGHELIDELRKGDMRRTTTEDKIREAEDKSAKQRETNEKQIAEKWLECADSLSRRQQEDFVEVSRALEHGEDLQFMGKDADFMNKIWEEKKKRPDVQDTAINPGVKPGAYRRARKD